MGDVLTDATEAGTTVLFGTLVCHDVVEAFGDEAFSNDNQGRAAAVVYFLDPLCNLLHGDLDLGDQDCVRACSHTGMQCDPADVAAHDLCNHAAVVRFTGGAGCGPCPRLRWTLAVSKPKV